MITSLGRALQSLMENTDLSNSIPINDIIPEDPQALYERLGYLLHPKTRQPVTQLTEYQQETWQALLEHKRILCIKSHKIGLSTSFLMADLQLCILPSSHPMSSKGYDTLILAQTKQLALEHIRTLRRMIINSPRYSKYLINRPLEADDNPQSIIRDDKSKQSVLFIRNNENERRPSRIIGLGIDNPGALESWKDIHHIHMSDPTAAIGDISEAVNIALSRLANTAGSCVIETIPGKPAGKIFEMWQKARSDPNYQFKLYEITAQEGVKAGIITEEFLEQQKQELGHLFGAYYEAKFENFSGSIFSGESIDGALSVQYNPDANNSATTKVLAIDPGMGTSKTGITVVELADGRVQVLYAKEFDRPNYEDMIDIVNQLIVKYDPSKIKADGANPEVVRSIKNMLGEREDYENVTDEFDKRAMRVQPIAFNRQGREMLANLKRLMDEGKIAIDGRFSDLITQLRIATATPDGNLDKKEYSLDLLDCLRMACSGFHVRRADF